ncbi:MAG TPA: tRNA (adenosine(37)-N6)-threonylcarbamoyltransferase complex dimerization subunit type 1 TsaB [Thermoanaerobaculia bacterium]|nr:tRNA (adenosine(37)-N6)-threonylcarbamoyltransferase complex dimerization subunit type 1 TsaB [Thermoanaerobaculia bacterium]
MIVLALDAASPSPAVALLSRGEIHEERLPSDRRASEALLPAIRRVLAAAGATLDATARIAVCAGPGSFTGLRVGLATAWGLARATGAELEAVSTLEALAESARPSSGSRVVAVLDAGRGDLVLERFDVSGARARSLGPPRLVAADDVRARAGEDPLVALPETLVVPPTPTVTATPAAALAAAVARAPGAVASRAAAPAGIYARPSAAEEKHGAA